MPTQTQDASPPGVRTAPPADPDEPWLGRDDHLRDSVHPDAPPVLAVVPGHIPAELRALGRWLNWHYGDRQPNGKHEKVPVNPRTGRRIDVTDRGQLGTFAEAVSRYERGVVDGVGLALSPDLGITAGDFDACLDPGTGAVRSAAVAADLARLGTYTEVSPSAAGLRTLGRGRLEVEGRNKGGGVEVYDRGHYVTVTGRRLPGSPAGLADCQDAFRDIQARIPAAKTSNARKPGSPVLGPASGEYWGVDADLLRRAFRARRNGDRVRRLWDGDTDKYDSPSEALLALAQYLAFWTGRDPARLEALLLASPLVARCEGVRAKWGSPRGASTWGRAEVIDPAVATCQAEYRGSRGPIQKKKTNTTCVSTVVSPPPPGLGAAWDRVLAGESAPGFTTADTRGRLASLCWHLAGRVAGGGFFLAERDAAARLGVTKTPARNQLRRLVADGVVEAVRRGKYNGPASDYRWLGPGGDGPAG